MGALPLALAAASLLGAHGAAAQGRLDRVVVPANTVVRAKLDQSVSTQTARVGERFHASLDEQDRSGFPDGTRFEGVVTEVRRHTKSNPGILNMEFRTAILPDGRRVPVNGELASLSDDDVRQTEEGRLESRKSGKLNTKWIGMGAAAGAVLGGILGDDWLKGGLLGGLGGAVYGYLNRDKSTNYRDVSLAAGTEFGVRLNQQVAFNDTSNYRYSYRTDRRYDDRYASDRYNDRVNDRYATDRYNDRYTDRTTDRYNDRYTDRTTDRYTDRTTDRYDSRYDDRYYADRDRVAGTRQERRWEDTLVRLDGRAVTFTDARPLRMNGELFVPLAPIARAAGMRFDHRSGAEYFTLHTNAGPVRGVSGDTSVMVRGTRTQSLTTAPLLVNGQIYVNAEYLSRVADLRADWNRRDMTLTLESTR